MTKIEGIMSRKKADILKRCFNLTVEAYPPETSELMKREKDRFLNPVGFTIRSEIENIFNEVVGTMDPDRLIASLENVIKIRAIQNFAPSEAVSFVYLLKRSIRDEVTATGEEELVEEMMKVDERIDRISLLAFDVYMQCREKIHAIRLKEAKVLHGRR